MRLLGDTHINFMKYRKFWISISLLMIAVFFFAYFFVHLNLGIDFAGGTQVKLRFRDQPQVDQLRTLLAATGLGEAEIQRYDEVSLNEVIIKTAVAKGTEEGSRERVVAALNRRFNQAEPGKLDLNQAGADRIAGLLAAEDPDHLGPVAATAASVPTAPGQPVVNPRQATYASLAEAVVQQRGKQGLFPSWDAVARTPGLRPAELEALKGKSFLGDYAVVGVENVGPQIGKELRRQGMWAVALSLLGMLGYIGLRFELRFGIGAVMASIHDVLITLGLFILVGYEFNLTTIAAFLTLIGYSTNDTVVIFDRVRENMRKNRRKPLIEVMNESINQTLSRTIMTSGLTMLTVAALLALGGEVLRGFAFVMTVGIIVGTYSSVYVASPFTLLWEQLFGAKSRIRGEAAGSQAAGSAAGATRTATAGAGAAKAAAPPRPQGPKPAEGSAPRPPRAAAGRRRSGRR
jgi:preprotein translocase subunit SecF